MGWFPSSLPTWRFYNFMKRNSSSLLRPTGLPWLLVTFSSIFHHPLLSAHLPPASVAFFLSFPPQDLHTWGPLSWNARPPTVLTGLAPASHSGQFLCYLLREHVHTMGLTLPSGPYCPSQLLSRYHSLNWSSFACWVTCFTSPPLECKFHDGRDELSLVYAISPVPVTWQFFSMYCWINRIHEY